MNIKYVRIGADELRGTINHARQEKPGVVASVWGTSGKLAWSSERKQVKGESPRMYYPKIHSD